MAIENLVFQGGSVKGIAYLGALEALAERDIHLADILRVAGTSAGAITASLLAVGHSVHSLNQCMSDLNFESLLDEKRGNTRPLFFGLTASAAKNTSTSGKASKGSGLVASHPSAASRLSSRISNTFGVYDGEALREFLGRQFYIQTGDADITFEELYEKHQANPQKFKLLWVTGVNLSTGFTEVFSHLHTPKLIIADAVRISLSIPLIFKPHTRYLKDAQGKRILAQPEHVYVDGGLLDNYPINLFDFEGFLDASISFLNKDAFWLPRYNPNTLGFRLLSEANIDYFAGQAAAPSQTIAGMVPYLKALLQALNNKQNSDYHRDQEIRRTISVHHLGIDTLAFNLTEEQKQALIASGREAVGIYFQQDAGIAEVSRFGC